MLTPDLRRYSRWSANEHGVAEDERNCREEVWPRSGARWLGYQCRARRGHGLNGWYCAQHAKRHPGWTMDDEKKTTTRETPSE